MRTTTCRIAIASVLLLSVPVQLTFTASESVLSQEKQQVTRLVERFLQAFEKRVHVHASNVPVLRQSPAPKTVKPAQAHEDRTPN
jgi:hypothetical protein